MRGALIHGVLLAVMLVYGYRTWTRDKTVQPNVGNVVRRWSFNQAAGSAPAGTTVTDPVSGTALATVQGTGATFSGKGLRLPGGASGSGAAYLQLPAGVISGHTHVTIEIWATPLSAQTVDAALSVATTFLSWAPSWALALVTVHPRMKPCARSMPAWFL